MIDVLNLDFGYEPGNGLVLCDVNIAIKHGELVAILGPNGSGKTTLIKHFNALFVPSSGEVYVNSLDTREKRNHRLIRETLSLVFQNPLDQFVGLTVFEDLAVPLRIKGDKEDEIKSKVEGILKRFDLWSLRDRYPHNLSGGEQKLVSIASSLMLDPKIIVLDEPTAMLDRGNRASVHKNIVALNKEQGKTLVIATCDPEEASLAGRIYVLYKGTISRSGTPHEVFKDKDFMEEIGVGIPSTSKDK